MIEHPETLNNQAILLASDGDFHDAIACFRRALTIQQDNYLLWFNLGVTYRDAGDLKNAQLALEKAYHLDNQNEEVLETLSTICLMQKQLEKARNYALEGLELCSTNSHFWNLLGVIFFQQESYEDAVENFEIAVSLNPYYEDALYNLRDTYDQIGNKSGVEECNKQLADLK